MNRHLSDLPGEGEQRDPVADFFADERAGIRDLPAGPDRWESIVLESRRPVRRSWLPYLAGAAAVVVAAGLVWGNGRGPATEQAADSASRSASVSSATMTATDDPTVLPTASSSPSSATSTPSTTGPLPVPKSFDLVSMTNAGGRHLFALGRASCSQKDCTAVVGSDDDGATWTALATFTTLTSPGSRATPDRDRQLVGIRFANPRVGYVFGSTTMRTVDGGRSWEEVDVDGRTVLSLETDGTRVWMATATSCQHGKGTAAQGCADLQVRSGAVTEPVTRPVSVPATPSAVDSAWITMDGSDAYLNRASSASMAPWPPIRVSGRPGPVVAPSECSNGAMWVTGTANSPGTLVGVCPSADTPAAGYSVAVSTDGGGSWTTRPATALGTPGGIGPWLAAPDAKHLVAVRQGQPTSSVQGAAPTLLSSADGGVTWRPAKVAVDGGSSWAGAAGGGLVYAFGGGLAYWRSDDSGATFERVPLRR